MADNEIITLWTDGPPTTIDAVPDEASFIAPAGIAQGSTIVRNISEATLTVFPSPDPNGVGIIVVPGGGWSVNMWTHEGVDIANWLTPLGYTCFVLKYRLQATPADPEVFANLAAATEAVHTASWTYETKPRRVSDILNTPAYQQARAACADDGRRAIEIVRKEAARFGLRDGALGMIGFSAGAYLTVDVARDPRADQLSFIAPIYGGESADEPVPADAPPLFTAVAQDDVLLKCVDGLVADWSAADRPVEMHTFRRGQHGFGLVKQGFASDRWDDMFVAWLRDLGY